MPLANPAARRELAQFLLRTGSPLSIGLRPSVASWLARFAAASSGERAEEGRRALEALTAASLALHAELAPLGTSFERRGIQSGAGFHRGEAQGDPGRFVGARAGGAPPPGGGSRAS